MEIIYIALLSLIAGCFGTLTGFGMATIMVPVLLLFYPLPETLLLSGIVHWFGNVWKVGFFWSGLRWKLILAFGIPGLLFTLLGALLVYDIPKDVLAPLLGVSLMCYTAFVYLNQSFILPARTSTSVLGGAFSGFMCGIFGVGGVIRAAFLSAFNLPKSVYLATLGCIGLIIDSGRIIAYLTQGTTITSLPLWSLVCFVVASFVGAWIAKRVIDHIPQQQFRFVVMVCLFVIAARYTFFG